MDWKDLHFFLAVATQRTLAGSARDLGVSQATVWRHIRQLEKSLEVRLFTRRGPGYALSAVGERLLETAQRVAAEVQTAERLLSDDARKLRGEIRLTAPELLIDKLVVSWKTLVKRHPALRLELVTGTPTAALSRKETDIALRYDASPQSDFVIERRYTVGFGIYASDAYIKRRGTPAALDRFEGHDLIGFDDSVGHVAPLRWLRRGGNGARIIFRSNSLQARASAAVAGIGCVLLPSLHGDGIRQLTNILDANSVGSLELCLFVNSRTRNSPRVAAVQQYVVDILEDCKSALAGT